jgi:hypothetical protein
MIKKMFYMIQDRGIYYWDENKLIKELDQLYLPKKYMKTIKD